MTTMEIFWIVVLIVIILSMGYFSIKSDTYSQNYIYEDDDDYDDYEEQ